MRSKKLFSIIELMTVILVILLLIALMIPMFSNLKMNARSALCKNNMRQIGALLTSYQMDHGGYLPNDDANGAYSGIYKSDIPIPKVGNNELYRHWQGHLLPYVDVNLPDKYTRYAMVTKIGSTRFSAGQLGSGVENAAPANILTNGWVVVDDAYRKGGYQDLKVFICPEIHQNTFDVGVSNAYNGLQIPRISQLCYFGFYDKTGYDYSMGGGVPTTYVANGLFFGFGNNNSFRADQINNITQKALVLEGGLADGSNWGAAKDPYYNIVGFTQADGYDLGTNHPGDCNSTISKTNPTFHKLSYVHDNFEQFWISDNSNIASGWWVSRELKMDFAEKFNSQFAGKAYMVPSTGVGNFTIVSFIDPEKGVLFNNFLKANNVDGNTSWGNFVPFIDEPNEYKYLTGNMNVLFGDGSVLKKDQGWLSMNRLKIAGLSQ